MNLYKKKEWKFLREEKLNINPVCEICKSFANLEIDHIIDHNQNLIFFYDIENLQTLCKSHHSKKTINEMKLKKYRIKNYGIYLKYEENRLFKSYLNFYENDFLAIENIIKKSEKIISDNKELQTIINFEIKNFNFKNLIDILKQTFFKNNYLPKIIYYDEEMKKSEVEKLKHFLINIYGDKKICLIQK